MARTAQGKRDTDRAAGAKAARRSVLEFLSAGIMGFTHDPADTDFQRGYLVELKWLKANLSKPDTVR